MLVLHNLFADSGGLSEVIQEMHVITGLSMFMSGVLVMIILGCLFVMVLLLAYGCWRVARTLIDAFFQQMEKRRGRTLYTEFLRRAFSFGITVFFIACVLGWEDLDRSLFGSAAVVTAVVGFAAQDVIKDTLAGLQISLYRPFDIGDRIELEDGTAGIVENITLRHIVLKLVDTTRLIVPNSAINSERVLNYSYGDITRSVLIKYPVSYDSDPEKVKEVIGSVIRNSPASVPGKGKNGEKEYGPVYFLELAGSALVFAVTVYYEASTPTEVVKDSINTAVFKALQENGIEIPYTYMNIVMKQDTGKV